MYEHRTDQAAVLDGWRILLGETLLCWVASTIAPESEISPRSVSRARLPCKLICSGRSRPVPLKSPRTLRMGPARALCARGHAERKLKYVMCIGVYADRYGTNLDSAYIADRVARVRLLLA